MHILSLFMLAAENGKQPSGWEQLLGGPLPMLIIFVVIMYLILIRPQQKRNREHRELISRLKAGDRVITSAGMYGTVSSVDEKTIELTIADNVVITISKNAVVNVLSDTSEEEKQGQSEQNEQAQK